MSATVRAVCCGLILFAFVASVSTTVAVAADKDGKPSARKNDPKKDDGKGNKNDPKKDDNKGNKNDPKKGDGKGNKNDPKKDDGKGNKNDPKKDDGKGNKNDPKKDDDAVKGLGQLKEMEFRVGGVKREALVQVPKSALSGPTPIVFVFHGHGQSMRVAANGFRIHDQWKDAICVYMQGLKTVTGGDPTGERSGWQNAPAAEGGRDLKFFDTVLAHFSKPPYQADRNRVYVTGFSNGANFSYVLWASRPNMVRAVAACAGASQLVKGAPPRPCLHIGGRKDTVVDFENQERTMDYVRHANGCEAKGSLWKHGGGLRCTLYDSSRGTPFVTAIHDGGHMVPDEAGRLIVKFFHEFAN